MRVFGQPHIFGTPLGQSAAAGGGVAAPVITTDAIIGTQLDAGAGYSMYQWQSSSDGAAWSDISGATAQTYTPTDAVFGLFLRVVGDGAASNATGRVAEVPAQSLGAELLTNGGFDSDTVWTKGTGWSIAAGVATKTAGSGSSLSQNTAVGAESLNETGFTISGHTGGSVSPFVGSGGGGSAVSANGTTRQLVRQGGTTTYALSASSFFAGNVDSATLKTVAPNAQLTAPSANMRLSAFYTLPASPVQGDQVWLVPRISDFSAGNYWLVLLEYTGSQWNITVYSVASHTRVSRITASNIGATDGIRVTMNGTAIALETTADGGDNWTPRGTPATNSTYQTETGVNVLHTSAVTPVTLEYEPAV